MGWRLSRFYTFCVSIKEFDIAVKKNLVLTGLLAAMVFLTTAYILHIPIVGGGYIHLGDAMVYLAAVLLPTPYGMAAAAIGGGLADLLTGAAVWAPATVIIKAVMVIAFTSKKDGILCLRNGIAPLLAGVVNVAGYFAAEIVLVRLSGGAWQAAVGGAVAAVPFNCVQALACGAAFVALAAAMDRLRVKQRLQRLQ